MPREIDGVAYLTPQEILADAGVTRQTLWRWRQNGQIPLGRRYRQRQLLFTLEEAALIRSFANRIEAITAPDSSGQLPLMLSERDRHGPP
jgi:hypothetical protein